MSKFIDIKQEETPVKVDFAKELLSNRKEAMSAMLGSLRDSVEARITNEHGQWARSNTTRFGRAMDALGVHIQPHGMVGDSREKASCHAERLPLTHSSAQRLKRMLNEPRLWLQAYLNDETANR